MIPGARFKSILVPEFEPFQNPNLKFSNGRKAESYPNTGPYFIGVEIHLLIRIMERAIK